MQSVIILLSIAAFSIVFPQPTLTGRISDWNNNPVPYALVVLKTAGRQTTTDLAGFFDFSQSTWVSARTEGGRTARFPGMAGGHLTFSISGGPAPVGLSVFTCDGRLALSWKDRVFAPGDYSIPVAPAGGAWRGSGLLIARVRIGDRTHVLRFHADRMRTRSALGEVRVPGFARRRAGVDSLVVSKFGYLTKRVAVESYDGDAGNTSLEYVFRTAGDPPGMRPVPGGFFRMGSTKGQGNETPVHSVIVSDFYIDSTEVTQADYAQLVGQSPWVDYTGPEPNGTGPTVPVWHVSWYDAVFYCNARSKRDRKDTVYSYTGYTGVPGNGGVPEGLTVHHDRLGYRLATEAEWEYACRAGTRSECYWGDLYDSASIDAYTWNLFNAGRVLHPVAQKLPNQLRLYDMQGNASEWCGDYYRVYYSSELEIDPTGPPATGERVRRGGGRRQRGIDLRSGFRAGDYPYERYDQYGVCTFRAVLPVR